LKKTGLAGLLIAFLAVTGWAQEPPPQLLLRVTQCLAAKNMLPRSKVTEMTFGYLVDEISYPREKVLFVVKYAAPTSSNGFVFAVFLTEHHDNQVFNIQNNARFVLSNSYKDGVSFEDPPLGGIWTQQRLASAIHRIEKQPRFTFLVKNIRTVDPPIHCESYADTRN
jgi:hypothetical protein